jgi:DNA-binding transcriptional LysR family regulator
LNGLGVIIAHQWMVSRIVDQGRLCRVLSDYTVRPGQGDADLYLVYPSRRGLSRNVRAFIDFLVDIFRAPPPDGALADGLEL